MGCILYEHSILIFANKQDLPGAKDINKLVQDYEFFKIKNHIWHIQPCSALNGEGLVTGIKWLSEQLTFRGKNNFPNNPYLMNDEDNQKKESSHNENKDISITVNDSQKDIISNNNFKNDNIGVMNNIDEIKVSSDKENNINNNINENNINNEK